MNYTADRKVDYPICREMQDVASCRARGIIKAPNHFIADSSAIRLDSLRLGSLGVRSSSAIRAENLFLRRQLALFVERKVKARRAEDGTRLAMVLLSRFFAWKDA